MVGSTICRIRLKLFKASFTFHLFPVNLKDIVAQESCRRLKLLLFGNPMEVWSYCCFGILWTIKVIIARETRGSLTLLLFGNSVEDWSYCCLEIMLKIETNSYITSGALNSGLLTSQRSCIYEVTFTLFNHTFTSTFICSLRITNALLAGDTWLFWMSCIVVVNCGQIQGVWRWQWFMVLGGTKDFLKGKL